MPRGMIGTIDNKADALDALLPTQTGNSGNVLTSNGTTHAWSQAGLVPVGAIVAWHKAFANTPALPSQFVECNGQTLSDAGSVYNGQVIPDLNGGGRFLRGNATSGTMNAASTALPTSSFTSGNASQTHTHTTVIGSKTSGDASQTHTHTTTIGNKTSGTESATHTHTQATRSQTISTANGGDSGTWNTDTTAATGTESATHTHTTDIGSPVSGTESQSHTHTTDIGSPVSGTESQSHTHTITGGGDAETAPINMTVVWIMRVK